MEDYGRLLYLALLLAAVGGWVAMEYRGRLGQATRVALAWGLIFLGAMAGYGVWQDIRGSVLMQQEVAGDGSVRLPRARDGHYYADVTIGGQALRFLVDTGATSVVLGREDAARLGLDPDRLAYTAESETANGVTRIAPVTLEDVRFGPFEDAVLRAYVNEGAMEGSLLGMDYLGRFRIEIDGDEMVLSR